MSDEEEGFEEEEAEEIEEVFLSVPSFSLASSLTWCNRAKRSSMPRNPTVRSPGRSISEKSEKKRKTKKEEKLLTGRADDEEGEEGAGGDKREAEEELEEVAEDRPQKRRAYGYDDLQGER